MNFKLFFFLFLMLIGIIFTQSCKEKTVNLTIPEEKLMKVLLDIYAADHIVNRATKDIRDSLSNLYINQILEIHDIQKSDLDENMIILQNNPKFHKTFYAKLDKLSEELSDKKLEDGRAVLK